MAQLFTQEFVNDPYPIYARMRDEGPVQHVTLPGGIDGWLVTDDAEVRRIFLDNDAFSKDMEGTWTAYREGRVPLVGDVVIGMGETMLVSDPPRHTRLRSLATKAFTRKRIEALAPSITETVAQLLTAITDKTGAAAGRADFVAEFSALLPIRVICPLIGVPDNDSDMLSAAVSTIMSNDENGQANAVEAYQRVNGYLAELVSRKQHEGGDDLTAALIEARDVQDRLSDTELVEMLGLLLAAGYETTVNLLSSAVLALLSHPDQLDSLLSAPAGWPAAIEEVLRWDGPVQNAIWRFTRQPVTIGQTTIPAGEAVALSVASAHRDPQRYPDPDSFDITRNRRDHIAFGHGIHRCVGAELARLEARLALPMIFDRLPGLRLDGEPRYRPSTVTRALTVLPVAFDKEAV